MVVIIEEVLELFGFKLFELLLELESEGGSNINLKNKLLLLLSTILLFSSRSTTFSILKAILGLLTLNMWHWASNILSKSLFDGLEGDDLGDKIWDWTFCGIIN